MKIGFSFGRCLGSIVRGEVAFDDVLCLIARTRMETEAQVRGVVEVYMDRHGYLLGLDQTLCEEIGVRLFNSGKILEPRANGINPMQVPRDYIWMDLFPTAPHGTVNESVTSAWEQYRMLITMVEHLPEEGYVPKHSDKFIEKELTEEQQAEQKKVLDMLVRAMV
jgi:hypothetical protein